MVPIRPGGGSKHNRRHVPADLDLLSAETFLWGDEGTFIIHLSLHSKLMNLKMVQKSPD